MKLLLDALGRNIVKILGSGLVPGTCVAIAYLVTNVIRNILLFAYRRFRFTVSGIRFRENGLPDTIILSAESCLIKTRYNTFQCRMEIVRAR